MMMAMLADHAGWALLVVTFLSCLVLPVPTSVLMVAAGGLVAAGDLGWEVALATPFAGAVAGDQAGYWLGRRGGSALTAWLARQPARAAAGARARDLIVQRCAGAVFLTRWLLAPLGPYVNVACGMAGVSWARFSVPAVAGKAVWVGLYVGVGFSVAGNIMAAGRTIGPVPLVAVLLIALVAAAYWLRQAQARKERRQGAFRTP